MLRGPRVCQNRLETHGPILNSTDQAMMRRAIVLAGTRKGQTAPNPAVGCVISKDGEIIAEAATAPGGRPHAEEQALALAGCGAVGATVFVTLEPCGERSSPVASCSHRLIAAGVIRVVYACEQADRFSGGRGPAALQAAGIATEGGYLIDEAAWLYPE